MKLTTSHIFVSVLSLFTQTSFGAFAPDIPPPLPIPVPEPEPVVMEATMVVKSLRSGNPVKINIKSRGVIPVVLLVENEIEDELVGEVELSADSLLEVAVPRFTKRYDVNDDGIQDYIFIFRTQDVLKGATETNKDVILALTVTYCNKPVVFTTQIKTITPKRKGWFKRGKRRNGDRHE